MGKSSLQGVSTGFRAPLTPCSFAAVVSYPALTSRHHLLPRLRTIGAVPSFPPYAFMAWAGTALFRSWLPLLYGVWFVDEIAGVWTSHSYFGHLLSSSCCHIDNYRAASKQRASYLGWQENIEYARLKLLCVMRRSFCDSRIRISWHIREVLKAVVLITLWWTFSTADVRICHWTQYWTCPVLTPSLLDIHINVIILRVFQWTSASKLYMHFLSLNATILFKANASVQTLPWAFSVQTLAF